MLSDDDSDSTRNRSETVFMWNFVRADLRRASRSRTLTRKQKTIEKMAKALPVHREEPRQGCRPSKNAPIAIRRPSTASESTRDVIPVHRIFTLQGHFLSVFHCLNRTVRAIAVTLNVIEQEYRRSRLSSCQKIDYFTSFPASHLCGVGQGWLLVAQCILSDTERQRSRLSSDGLLMQSSSTVSNQRSVTVATRPGGMQDRKTCFR